MRDAIGMDQVTKALAEHGDAFAQMCADLYGDGAWEVVRKLAETSEQKSHRRQAAVGLATNTVGIAAATAATRTAIKDFKSPAPIKPLKSGLKPLKAAYGVAVKHPKAVAGAALGLQGANLAGDFVANRVLARGAKKKGSLQPTGVKKNLDVLWRGEISKRDDEKRQVFGWASVVELDGKPVVDLQGDYLPIDVIEKAAYKYVQESRKGGDMHEKEDQGPKEVSGLIESFLVTAEKKEAMNLPEEFPTGWWVGFQVTDEDTWQLVKDGKRKEFSIHGSGRRVEREI